MLACIFRKLVRIMQKTRQILPKTGENETTTTSGNVSNSAPKPKLTFDSTINSGAISVYRVLTAEVPNANEVQTNTVLETTVTQPRNNTPQGECSIKFFETKQQF